MYGLVKVNCKLETYFKLIKNDLIDLWININRG